MRRLRAEQAERLQRRGWLWIGPADVDNIPVSSLSPDEMRGLADHANFRKTATSHYRCTRCGDWVSAEQRRRHRRMCKEGSPSSAGCGEAGALADRAGGRAPFPA